MIFFPYFISFIARWRRADPGRRTKERIAGEKKLKAPRKKKRFFCFFLFFFALERTNRRRRRPGVIGDFDFNKTRLKAARNAENRVCDRISFVSTVRDRTRSTGLLGDFLESARNVASPKRAKSFDKKTRKNSQSGRQSIEPANAFLSHTAPRPSSNGETKIYRRTSPPVVPLRSHVFAPLQCHWEGYVFLGGESRHG